MTDLHTKAMKMALEFIVLASSKDRAWFTEKEFEVVAALRQALAQLKQKYDYRIKYDRPCYKCRSNFCPGNCKEPEYLEQTEQEPVAGMFEEKLPDQNPPQWVRDYNACLPTSVVGKAIRHTPPKREWQGLTEEEIDKTMVEYPIDYKHDFAKAIEAKLKEKNI